MSGYAAANHSAVTETLTGSPPSPISLILNRILLETGAIDRRKRRNYRGHVRRVKLGGIRLRSGFLLANRVERGRALPPKLIAGGFGRANGWGPHPSPPILIAYLLEAPSAAPPPNSRSDRRSSSLKVSCKPANQSNSAPAPARARE